MGSVSLAPGSARAEMSKLSLGGSLRLKREPHPRHIHA